MGGENEGMDWELTKVKKSWEQEEGIDERERRERRMKSLEDWERSQSNRESNSQSSSFDK